MTNSRKHYSDPSYVTEIWTHHLKPTYQFSVWSKAAGTNVTKVMRLLSV